MATSARLTEGAMAGPLRLAPGFFACRIFCAEPASTSAENAPGPQYPPEASGVEAASTASSTNETSTTAPIPSASDQRFQSAARSLTDPGLDVALARRMRVSPISSHAVVIIAASSAGQASKQPVETRR